MIKDNAPGVNTLRDFGKEFGYIWKGRTRAQAEFLLAAWRGILDENFYFEIVSIVVFRGKNKNVGEASSELYSTPTTLIFY